MENDLLLDIWLEQEKDCVLAIVSTGEQPERMRDELLFWIQVTQAGYHGTSDAVALS